MSSIRCHKCGAENPEGSRYCMKCAALLAPAPAPIPPIESEKPSNAKPLSTIAYFGLMILFSLPIIGFIMAIVLAFAPENQNIKHFSRAQILFSLLALILGVVAVLVASSAAIYLYPYFFG